MSDKSLIIASKLNSLGITSEYGKTPIDEIEKFEENIGAKLPPEYKEFLHSFGVLNFNDVDIAFYPSINDVEEKLSMVSFYGFSEDSNDLRLITNRYKDRIPSDLIPMVELPGGDQLCIGVSSKTFGKVYYWNHDKEKSQMDSIEDMWLPVVLIFNSFADLIMSFQVLEEDVTVRSSVVKSIKMSDKFLSRLKK